MILNMMRKSIQLEIDQFIKLIFNKDNKKEYSKQAFSEARQKLSPDVFKISNDNIISQYYSDDDFKKYKGYRLLSIDATILEIPNNKETRIMYGYAENGTGSKTARAMSSDLYDIENDIIISAKLDRYTSSERKLAKENIEKMLGYKHDNSKNLILFDKGYPSIEMISFLMEKGINFLMRAKKVSLKEIDEAKEEDQEITIKIDKNRRKELKRQGADFQVGQSFKIRVIRVKLENGEEEILITNLSPDILSVDEAKELYFKRWGIETKFDGLKNRLEIENFSGNKPIAIEQDFYASILISNLAALIRQDAEEEAITNRQDKKLKYEYKINTNILFGKLKINLISLLMEDDNDERFRLYNDLVQDIASNVVPIRKNRQFPRKKSLKRNKYPNNKRRCL
jgi:hypothetical protein